jgi:hypothetical protein
MKNLLLLFILFITTLGFSQQKPSVNNTILPASIYTFKIRDTFTPNYTSVNKNLNFKKTYSFAAVSFEDIDKNRFMVTENNLTNNVTKFIYDDYNSYKDNNLLKGFFEKYDLTRWQPRNFIAPSIN